MYDKMLVAQCAPTLSGIKTANLFSCSFSSECELEQTVKNWNLQLGPKGVVVTVVNKHGERALVYVCRPVKLEQDLQCEGVCELLSHYGYQSFSVSDCVCKLKERLSSSQNFPHEIGLFLGYPLYDVKGFIENDGKNCKLIGCWKVYYNECEAAKIFAKFKKCKEVYLKLYENRKKSVSQLTVAVS